MSGNLQNGQKLASAAASFIGVRFRLYGRDPNGGLDCVGLLACSLEKIGANPKVPEGYRLRNTDLTLWTHFAELSGLERVSNPITGGDVLLTRPGPGQHHLLIAASDYEAIHAHAGLGRVVSQPLTAVGSVTAQWRLR